MWKSLGGVRRGLAARAGGAIWAGGMSRRARDTTEALGGGFRAQAHAQGGSDGVGRRPVGGGVEEQRQQRWVVGGDEKTGGETG